MAEYKTDCSKFSFLGGGESGMISSCKGNHSKFPWFCPANCPHYDGKPKYRSSHDDYIMDFGAGAAPWYRVD